MNKKLYIPTTTLNFNNILSSESVSPKTFYSRRGFGYSRWLPVAENPFDNSIVLYESCCLFDRPKSDYEDHPLLIEINMEESELESLKKVSNGIYLCGHTIYLDPWNTRLIFFSEEDRKITLSMSDSSFETKLIRLYEKKINVEKPEQKYSAIQIKDIDTINSQAIRNDYQFNKMKGLFYGYYIGALFGTTKDALIRMNVLREIKNTFAAILSSFDKEATAIQQSNLNRLFDFLLQDTPLFKEILNRTKDEILTRTLIDVIKSEYGYINGTESLNSLLSGLKMKSINDRKNSSIEWIESQISEQEQSMRKENSPVSTIDSEIIIQDYHVSFISDSLFDSKKDKELYLLWIKDVLSSSKYNGKISSIREALSDDITIKAKEFYGKDWDISSAKIVLNSLRRHVRGGNFVYNWDNSLFSSISAIVTNGEDWNKLLRYMQSHELNDYRLAFSMYGCLNGFANLTREFTDYLFNQDSKYIAEVYKEYYGQFFGKDLETNKIDIICIAETSKKNKELTNNANKEEQIQKSQNSSEIDSTAIDWKEKVRKYVKTIKTKAKNFNENIEQMLQVCSSIENFLNKLPKGKSYDKIRTEFYTKAKADSQLCFQYDDKMGKTFYLDTNAFEIIQSLLPNNRDVQEQIKKDLCYFQNNYKVSYYDEDKGRNVVGKYKDSKKDNESVISSYRIFLDKRSRFNYTQNERWAKFIRDVYTKVDIERIIENLKKAYK